MSRKKSQITLRVHNKSCNSKHNFPKELILISEEIEKLSFVTGPLGRRIWKPISCPRKNKIEIIGFDYQTKSFSAKIYGNHFEQKFFIKVDIPKDEDLLESKCLEKGIEEIKERQNNSYYYNQLIEFYEREIIKTVENFYKK
jgi:hypothetical protein